MKRLFSILALVFPVIALACTPDYVKFSNGAVRQMAPAQSSTAVYLDIQNTGSKPITIVDVSSPDAPHVSLHKTVTNSNGVARMEHMSVLELAPNSTTRLAPGGLHVMLEGVQAPLKQPQTITLVFTYEDKSTSTIQGIPVKPMLTK